MDQELILGGRGGGGVGGLDCIIYWKYIWAYFVYFNKLSLILIKYIVLEKLKGNPNFQGILDWIHPTNRYCIIIAQEATQKYRKLTDYWTKSCFLFALLSVYCNLCFLLPSSIAKFFHFLTVLHKFWTSQVIICAVYSFSFWFENGFLQLKPARYYCLHKKLCLQ